MNAIPLAVQLYSVRGELASGAAAAIGRIAELGLAGVEPVCSAGMPAETRDALAGMTVDAAELKLLLDEHGLVVSSAHTALPESHNANAVLDEQELLGNDLLIVSDLSALSGATIHDLDRLDTLKRTAERFNCAAALAAKRGMRVGYHNHFWEWDSVFDGRPAFDVFWDYLDPSVVAEIDIYWAQFAGRRPAEVMTGLGRRAQLAHVKDGPLTPGQPMTPAGTGKVDIAGALTAGDYLRWHIIEFDECATDIFDAISASVGWLVESGLSSAR